MNLAQRVAVNTSAQIAGQFLGILVSLVSLRVTTGYLGVDDFGELAIILAVGGLLVTVSNLGVTTTLARELAKTPEDADRLAGSLLRFRVLSLLGLLLATLAVVPALPYSTQTKLGLALYLVSVLGQSLATFPKAFFQVHLKLHLQATVDLTSKVLSLAAVSVVAVFDLGFYVLVGAISAVGLAGFGLAFMFLRRFWRPTLRWESGLGSRLVRDTLAVGLVSTIGLLHFRADAILLSLLAPARDVGIYTIAYGFVDYAFILPGFFVAAVFPILTRRVHEGPGRADETINRTFQVLAVGSAAVGLSVLTLARPIVHLIAGPDFDEAVEPARILAFSFPLIFCAPVFYNLCIAVNRQRLLIGVGLASLALNLALNLVLIPRYTYNGAAIATVISEALAFAGSYWAARRTVRFHFELGFLARLGAAVAVAGVAAVLLIDRSELAAFALGELALVVTAYVVGAVRSSDVRIVLGREWRAGGAS